MTKRSCYFRTVPYLKRSFGLMFKAFAIFIMVISDGIFFPVSILAIKLWDKLECKDNVI
jgi:hypothetical protein